MKKKNSTGARKGDKVRSVIVSVRLDPKLRYLADLAARQQRRTLSGYIEWAVLDSFSKVEIAPSTTLASKSESLWDVFEPDRLVRLGYDYAHLLDFEGQVLWKLIKECGPLWKSEDNFDPQNEHLPARGLIDMTLLTKHWADFKAVASGEADRDILPKYGESVKGKTKHTSITKE